MRATIYKPETVELQIESATILSTDEALNLPVPIRRTGYRWWLRSPDSRDASQVVAVMGNGHISPFYSNVSADSGVRPAFVVSNLEDFNCVIGDTITIKSKRYVVIDTNKILYNDEPVRCQFNSKNSNDYETSDLKQFVNGWLKDLKNETD